MAEDNDDVAQFLKSVRDLKEANEREDRWRIFQLEKDIAERRRRRPEGLLKLRASEPDEDLFSRLDQREYELKAQRTAELKHLGMNHTLGSSQAPLRASRSSVDRQAQLEALRRVRRKGSGQPPPLPPRLLKKPSKDSASEESDGEDEVVRLEDVQIALPTLVPKSSEVSRLELLDGIRNAKNEHRSHSSSQDVPQTNYSVPLVPMHNFMPEDRGAKDTSKKDVLEAIRDLKKSLNIRNISLPKESQHEKQKTFDRRGDIKTREQGEKPNMGPAEVENMIESKNVSEKHLISSSKVNEPAALSGRQRLRDIEQLSKHAKFKTDPRYLELLRKKKPSYGTKSKEEGGSVAATILAGVENTVSTQGFNDLLIQDEGLTKPSSSSIIDRVHARQRERDQRRLECEYREQRRAKMVERGRQRKALDRNGFSPHFDDDGTLSDRVGNVEPHFFQHRSNLEFETDLESKVTSKLPADEAAVLLESKRMSLKPHLPEKKALNANRTESESLLQFKHLKAASSIAKRDATPPEAASRLVHLRKRAPRADRKPSLPEALQKKLSLKSSTLPSHATKRGLSTKESVSNLNSNTPPGVKMTQKADMDNETDSRNFSVDKKNFPEQSKSVEYEADVEKPKWKPKPKPTQDQLKKISNGVSCKGQIKLKPRVVRGNFHSGQHLTNRRSHEEITLNTKDTGSTHAPVSSHVKTAGETVNRPKHRDVVAERIYNNHFNPEFSRDIRRRLNCLEDSIPRHSNTAFKSKDLSSEEQVAFVHPTKTRPRGPKRKLPLNLQ